MIYDTRDGGAQQSPLKVETKLLQIILRSCDEGQMFNAFMRESFESDKCLASFGVLSLVSKIE